MSASTFAFRVDASLDIGTGHVMRCLTLAASLRERGADCCFICRQHPGNLLDLIREQGFEVHVLPLELVNSKKMTLGKKARPAHAHWLCADGTTDANQTLNLLRKTPVDWLIVDHYALDVHWESALRPICRHLMVIDDLADRPHDCDLLLDQNLGRTAADYTGLVPAHCTILAGTKYALLRPEFATLRPYSLARRSPPRLKHLLITMGGVDKYNITGQVLEALKACRLPDDLRITVVMGPHAPSLEQVLNQVGQMLWKTEVLVNVRDMAKLMAESDLAIGAVGQRPGNVAVLVCQPWRWSWRIINPKAQKRSKWLVL